MQNQPQSDPSNFVHLLFRRWFTSPVFGDDEFKTRRAALLNIVFSTGVIILPLIIFSNLIGGNTPPIILTLNGLMLFFFLLMRYLVQRGHLPWASISFMTVVFTYLTYALANLGTVRSPTTALYTLWVIGAGILFDRKGLVASFILSSLAVLGLIWAESHRLLPPADFSVTITQWTIYSMAFGAAGALTLWALEEVRHALARADQEISEHKRTEETLRVSEQRFASLFQANPAAQLIVMLENRQIIDANEAFLKQTEYALADLKGRSTLDVGLWADPRQARDMIEQLRSVGYARNLEIDFKSRSGKIANTLTSFQIIDLQGTQCIISTILDITERKQAEIARRQAQARYSALFEQSHDAVFILDLHGRHLQFNHRAAEMLGYTAEEMIDLSVNETSTELGSSLNILARLLADEQIPVYERRFRKKDGTIIPVEINVELIRDVQGQPLHIQSVVRDIRERKRAEEALRVSEDKYRLLVETTYEGVWVIDRNQHTSYVNQSMAEMLGYTPAEMLGRPVEDFITAEDAAFYRQRIDKRRAGEDEIFERQLARRDGSPFWVQISARVVKDSQGNFNGSFAMFTDMTERKQAEQLVQAQRDLARLTSTVASDQQVWPRCLEIALQVTGMDSGGIYLFNETDDTLQLVEHCGLGQDFIQSVAAYPVDTPNAQFVLMGQMHYFSQADLQTEPLYQAEGLHVFISAPIQYQERVLGCVNLGSHTLSQVSGFSRRALEALAAEIGGIAIYLRTESALRKNQALLSEAQRIGRMGHWEWTAPSQNLTCSDELFHILGVSPGSNLMTFNTIRETLHPDDQARLYAWDRQAFANQTNLDYEFRIILSDGNMRWLHQFAQVTYSEDGKPIRMLGTIQDITERKQALDALATSQSRLKGLIDSAMDAIISVNQDMQIVLFNAAAERMFGVSASQVIGQSPDQFIPERFRSFYRQRLVQSSQPAAGKPIQKQGNSIIGLRANGEEFPAEETLSFVETQGEKLYTAILRDVSARQRAEEALRASEERYRGLIHSLDSVVATVDAQGRFVYMNDIAAQQLGGTPGQFIGHTMHELFPEPVASRQLAAVQQVFRQDRGSVSEDMSIVNGVSRWYRNSVQPIHDERGRVVQVLVNSTDIHALKTAEQELRELNRTLEERVKKATAEIRDLYENAPAGYHSLDADGKLVIINQTELNWLGYTRDEMIGHSIQEVLTPASRRVFQETWPLFKQHGHVADLELEFVRKDGTSFPVLENKTAIYDEQQNYIMSRTTVVDMTDRKAAEQALRIANTEMERALRLKDEFLAVMSHELRTPLNAVLGLSESLSEQILGPLNERQLNALNTIDASGRHLLSVINDILDMSGIQAGKVTLDARPVNVRDVCELSLRFISPEANRKQIQITSELDWRVEWISSNERRLRQMLINLLSNAIKFTPTGGQVKLQVVGDCANQTALFSVWDNGIGIAAEDFPRLFKPFGQLDSRLARNYEGTGLGLVLVARIAEMHGGSVSVKSEPGRGSCFTISLPWSTEMQSYANISTPFIGEPITPTVSASPSPIPSKWSGDANAPLILIAEDNESNILALATFLQSRKYRLLIAQDGKEALEMVYAKRPDLILMDLQMPMLDGWGAIRQLRQSPDPQIAGIPIIAVTALAMPGDRERALIAGANEYMSKPVNLKQLSEMIKRLRV